MESYLPPLSERVRQGWDAVCRVWNRPTERIGKTDCVVVCDPIEAYRPLYTASQLFALRRLIRAADEAGATIVYTRWTRIRGDQFDAVDVKGHWAWYVPDRSQTRILPEIASTVLPTHICDVKFPNAFAQREVRSAFKATEEEDDARIPRVFLAGAWLESCVTASAHGALEHNVRPYVVADACAGHLGAFARFLTFVKLQLGCAEVVRV